MFDKVLYRSGFTEPTMTGLGIGQFVTPIGQTNQKLLKTPSGRGKPLIIDGKTRENLPLSLEKKMSYQLQKDLSICWRAEV